MGYILLQKKLDIKLKSHFIRARLYFGHKCTYITLFKLPMTVFIHPRVISEKTKKISMLFEKSIPKKLFVSDFTTFFLLEKLLEHVAHSILLCIGHYSIGIGMIILINIWFHRCRSDRHNRSRISIFGLLNSSSGQYVNVKINFHAIIF